VSSPAGLSQESAVLKTISPLFVATSTIVFAWMYISFEKFIGGVAGTA
jgi:hypothetical protein